MLSWNTNNQLDSSEARWDLLTEGISRDESKIIYNFLHERQFHQKWHEKPIRKMTNSIETGKHQIYRAVKKCLSFAIFYAFLARRSTARSSAVGINNGLFGVKPTGKYTVFIIYAQKDTSEIRPHRIYIGWPESARFRRILVLNIIINDKRSPTRRWQKMFSLKLRRINVLKEHSRSPKENQRCNSRFTPNILRSYERVNYVK